MNRALVYALVAWLVSGLLFAMISPLIAPPNADFVAAGRRFFDFSIFTIVPAAFLLGLLHHNMIEKRARRKLSNRVQAQTQHPPIAVEPPPLPKR